MFLQAFYIVDRDSAQPWRIQVQLIDANKKPKEKRSRNQKKEKEQGCENFRNLQNFSGYKFLLPVKLSFLRHCSNCLPLFIVSCCFLLFDFFLSPFGLFPIFPQCNSTCFDILVILYWVLSIKDPRHDTVNGIFCWIINKI